MSLQVALVVALLDLAANMAPLPFLMGLMDEPLHLWALRPFRRSSPVGDVHRLRRIEIHNLVAAEVSEFLIPIFFSGIYLICRYSPNGKWMGGVGANIWHYHTPDLLHFFCNLGFLLGGDLVVVLVTHMVVRRYMGMNLMAFPERTIRCNGPSICLALAFVLYHQMCIIVVHCGMDFTFSDRAAWPDALMAP